MKASLILGSLSYPDAIDPYVLAFERCVLGIAAWQLLDGKPRFRSDVPIDEPLRLDSNVGPAQPIRLPLAEIQSLVDVTANVTVMASSLAQQLLGHCWKIMQRRPGGFPKARDAGPTLEFYRHVRNACFHGNRFLFDRKKGEPRFTAEWRGIVLSPDLEQAGSPVFQETAPVGDHLLKWGDALLLIADACAEIYGPEEYSTTQKADVWLPSSHE